MESTLLTERLLAAAGDRTYRSLAELTGSNAETVRRYMQGQAPSVEFLAALCTRLGISEQWLISGRGPMKASQLRSHALKEASASELFSAMAATLERLAERVDRLELFLSSLEVRLRGRTIGRATAIPPPDEPERHASAAEVKPAHCPAHPTDTRDARPHPTSPSVTSRAQRLADAISQRSRPNDR